MCGLVLNKGMTKKRVVQKTQLPIVIGRHMRADINLFFNMDRTTLLTYMEEMLKIMTDEQHGKVFRKLKVLRSRSQVSDRSIDWQKIPRRHVSLCILYDGAEFSGLTAQAHMPYTVENCIFMALKSASLIPSDASLQDVRFSRSGRTDKGVSGTSQVISLFIRSSGRAPESLGFLKAGSEIPLLTDISLARDIHNSEMALKDDNAAHGELPSADDVLANIPSSKVTDVNMRPITSYHRSDMPFDDTLEIDYVSSLNGRLPHSIRVMGWAPVDFNFCARHSAHARQYRYVFGPVGTLNIEAMARACNYLIGFHDFRNLCKPVVANVQTFVRVIYECRLDLDGEPYHPDAASNTSSEEQSVEPSAKSALINPCLASLRKRLAALSDNEASASATHDPPTRFTPPENIRKKTLSLFVKGNAFLYHQIRCIVSILIHIGANLEPPELILRLFDTRRYPGKLVYNYSPGETLIFSGASYFSPRLPRFYISDKAYQHLRRSLSVSQLRFMAGQTLFGQALQQIAEMYKETDASKWFDEPHCHVLSYSTLQTNVFNELYRDYTEGNCILRSFGKYKRIENRKMGPNIDKLLAEKQALAGGADSDVAGLSED